jgi:hypothetical protein
MQAILEYLNFRRVFLIQEILYNSNLTLDEINKHRGALHEVDQAILLPQTAKKHHDFKEEQLKAMRAQEGIKTEPSKSN